MATIEKRKRDGGTVYRVKVRLRGHPPADATFDRITDAKRWAAETETAIRAGRYFERAEARQHTLAELIDRFLAEYLPTSRIRTKANTIQHLKFWRAELGSYPLADVTPARITEARAKLLERPGMKGARFAPATANKYVAGLSGVFTIARKNFGFAVGNPCCGITKLAEPRGRIRFLSDAERDALLRECKAHSEALHAIVILALSTGARKGEILGLRWQDVDMQRGLMTFHQTKNGERRTVPIVGIARLLLAEHGKVRRINTEFVFPGYKGRPLEIGRMFCAACTRAEIADFRFHDLRHTAASWIAMNGGTTAEIAEVLGHKTLQMVKRYSHLTEGHTRGVLERMASRKLG
ncbi:MAG: site-specific integrase [Rhodanobacter sp.]|jgi:integrase|nr:site-specific integrase [Rhodanobacter sp.]